MMKQRNNQTREHHQKQKKGLSEKAEGILFTVESGNKLVMPVSCLSRHVAMFFFLSILPHVFPPAPFLNSTADCLVLSNGQSTLTSRTHSLPLQNYVHARYKYLPFVVFLLPCPWLQTAKRWCPAQSLGCRFLERGSLYWECCLSERFTFLRFSGFCCCLLPVYPRHALE
jgi:hypothetical protein